jgi:hypothetical protein
VVAYNILPAPGGLDNPPHASEATGRIPMITRDGDSLTLDAGGLVIVPIFLRESIVLSSLMREPHES